ncbi:MAG: hypothetical protein L3K17_00595 [Thermoplasmata archaeon]|nr:hypothetical protein [Thermoplasmata archaeon]
MSRDPPPVPSPGPIRVTILATGYTGGRRVAYLLAGFAVVLFAVAGFDVIFPTGDGWSAVGLWAGAGLVFLITADVSGLNFTLQRQGPAELTDVGFAAPFFRFSDYRPIALGVGLRSRVLRLPLAKLRVPNCVPWQYLVTRVGSGPEGPYLELWPLKGAPFRSLLTGVRSSLPGSSVAQLACFVDAAGGDLHVVGELLTDAGRAACSPCDRLFRSDSQFGFCLPSPKDVSEASGWFRETVLLDARRVTSLPVERAPGLEAKP